jgi:hypothetical protein
MTCELEVEKNSNSEKACIAENRPFKLFWYSLPVFGTIVAYFLYPLPVLATFFNI